MQLQFGVMGHRWSQRKGYLGEITGVVKASDTLEVKIKKGNELLGLDDEGRFLPLNSFSNLGYGRRDWIYPLKTDTPTGLKNQYMPYWGRWNIANMIPEVCPVYYEEDSRKGPPGSSGSKGRKRLGKKDEPDAASA